MTKFKGIISVSLIGLTILLSSCTNDKDKIEEGTSIETMRQDTKTSESTEDLDLMWHNNSKEEEDSTDTIESETDSMETIAPEVDSTDKIIPESEPTVPIEPETEPIDTQVDTKNLTEEQVKKWVFANMITDKERYTEKNFLFFTSFNEEGELLITVRGNQRSQEMIDAGVDPGQDSIHGYYKINKDGYLTELNFGTNNYDVIATVYNE